MNRVTIGLVVLVLITGACISIGCSSNSDSKNKQIIGTITSVQISGSVSEGRSVAISYKDGRIVIVKLKYGDSPVFYMGKRSVVTINDAGYVVTSEYDIDMSIGMG